MLEVDSGRNLHNVLSEHFARLLIGREIFNEHYHLNFTCNFSKHLTPPLHVVNMYINLRATNSYFRLEDVKHHRNITTNPVHVNHASGEIMSSTHTNTMYLSTRVKNNIEGHVLPDSKSVSLLSIGQLCDNGCNAYFTKNIIYIIHNNTIILEGHRKKYQRHVDNTRTSKILHC